MVGQVKLSALEWAQERYENTLRIAAGKTGADHDGWIEDAVYWLGIIRHMRALYRIAADDSECGCTHDDPYHCCAQTDDAPFCSRCVAALAIAEAEAETGQFQAGV